MKFDVMNIPEPSPVILPKEGQTLEELKEELLEQMYEKTTIVL